MTPLDIRAENGNPWGVDPSGIGGGHGYRPDQGVAEPDQGGVEQEHEREEREREEREREEREREEREREEREKHGGQ